MKAAAKEIIKIIQDQELKQENTYLRLGVKGGGCSGFTYFLDLIDSKKFHSMDIFLILIKPENVFSFKNFNRL